jgi:hypothetical protein
MFVGCYCENLPSESSALIIGGYEITMNDIKIENKFGMGVCAFLPDIPKLNRTIYHVYSEVFYPERQNILSHTTRIAKQLLPSKNEKSKCIIMLANESGIPYSNILLETLKARYSCNERQTFFLLSKISRNFQILYIFIFFYFICKL